MSVINCESILLCNSSLSVQHITITQCTLHNKEECILLQFVQSYIFNRSDNIYFYKMAEKLSKQWTVNMFKCVWYDSFRPSQKPCIQIFQCQLCAWSIEFREIIPFDFLMEFLSTYLNIHRFRTFFHLNSFYRVQVSPSGECSREAKEILHHRRTTQNDIGVKV